jgi:hypothetical protein
MNNNYTVNGNAVEIEVVNKHGEFIVTIDKDDLKRIPESATITVKLSNKSKKYKLVCIYYNGATEVFSCFLFGTALKGYVNDHEDRNTLNNSRSNIRVITIAENTYNRSVSCNSKSGIRGVYWCKSHNKWRCEATYEGKRHRLGRYDTLVEARRVIRKFWEERGIAI